MSGYLRHKGVMVRGTDQAVEATRNRLLRRADWRFLLPQPWPAKSICFAQGQLRDATMAISDVMVDAEAARDGTCDLAVAINPNAATLAQAWRALRPGGSCYTEWYRPVVDGAAIVRQRLTQRGFGDVACYWPWPWPEKAPALFWLPLDAPAALDYFLSNRPGSSSPGRGVGRAGVRWLWKVGRKMQVVVPVCAIAHKPLKGSTTDRSVPEQRSARNLLDSLGLEGPDSARGLDFQRRAALLLTGGQRPINKVVTLIFADQEAAPRLIVKMSRVPESDIGLQQEAVALQAVHAGRPNGMQGVPRVLRFEATAGRSRLCETALTGQPLFTLLRPDNFRALALQVTDWLIDLAGDRQWCARSMWSERLVEAPLHDFEQAFGTVVDKDALAVTRSALALLGDLPLVCEQRDFSPWNVLLDAKSELVILDWESAELQGLPALDLIYFLSYLAFFLDGAMRSLHVRPSYRTSLDRTTFTGGVVHDCLMRYVAAIGIEPSMLRPLRMLVWLIHARAEYQRLRADAGGQPDAAALRRSIFVGLWEEEVRYAFQSR